MRLPPEGTPFVPPKPLCPTFQQGHLSDLEAVPFLLTVEPGKGRPTEVGGEFYVDAEDIKRGYVETDIMQPPPDPSLLQRLLELTYTKTESGEWGRALNNTQSPFVERVRKRFCERVANCLGVIDGECWALGKSAVKEVIEQALKDHDGESI